MSDKKDKDIWDKISDAAATAGKAIGDEYQRLRLTHDIWLLDRDLQRAYAKAGRIIHERHMAESFDADEELRIIFVEIEALSSSIEKLEENRESLKVSAHTPVDEKDKGADAGAQREAAAMEFLDEDDLPFFCPECGERVDMYSGKMPKHCVRCGHKLKTE